jgi:cation-transporting ATPase 13A1
VSHRLATPPRCLRFWINADILVSRGPIDLEAKFEANLLNTAVFLLGLSQQVSTFAINFQVSHDLGRRLSSMPYVCVQGRPFREGIRENSALYWGLVGASAVAFSGATDFIPELNRWLQVVEMDNSVSHRSSLVGFRSRLIPNSSNSV